jgi:MATE family multidrug resistance protein
MVSSLSLLAMLFVDRLLLAYYSTQALNAAVNAATLGWGFGYSAFILGNIAEIFVAQFNGAGEKEKIGQPVWQMIWIGLASTLIFVPLGLWGPEWFYGNSPDKTMERDYFSLMMFYGPSFPIYGALTGYFIGQGKTSLLTFLAVATNIVNAILDWILIFGIEGFVPAMGVKGAAIATSSSSCFQVIVLAYIFLNQYNRTNHKTGDCRINLPLLKNCLKIGFPNALFIAIELFGWAAFYYMMTLVGEKYITLAGICQSVMILLYFFGEGLNKGIITIVGNLIGAKESFLVPKVLKSGIKLLAGFICVVALTLFFYSDFVIDQFLNDSDSTAAFSYRESLKTCLFLMIIYLVFEVLRLLFFGLLTAVGDTMFLLVAGSISVWIMLVLPVYIFVVRGNASIEAATLMCVIYQGCAAAIYFYRYYTKKWENVSLIHHD